MGMNPRLLRPTASGFDPRRISGLTGWWDASDAATITLNGTTVSEWRDKSGASRHLTQSTAANQPTYLSSGLGSKPSVRLAQAVTNRMNTSALMDELGDDSSQLVTVFAVVRGSGATVGHKTFGEVDNGGGFGFYHRFADGVAYFDAGDESTARVSASIADLFSPGGLWVGRRSGAQVDQWINGTLRGTRSNASGSLRTASNIFGIAGTTAGTVAYSEIVIYKRALSTSERQRLQEYVAKKYGLTIA
jgi:hypothetical protein